MPRKPLIRVRNYPYHVTARCNNKEPFPCSLQTAWNIISQEINEITEKFQCKIHAFVLMPNHFHLLLTTPQEDLGVIMKEFLMNITKKMNTNTRRSGRIFVSRYHWSLIDDDQYYDCALKYIYRNPVKAKLVDGVEQYQFSSLKFVLENEFVSFPVEPPVGHAHNIPQENSAEFLRWLNRPFNHEQQEAIKKGFNKTRFAPTRIGWRKGKKSFEGMRYYE
jgi:REP element-mobilizing transposase RayT